MSAGAPPPPYRPGDRVRCVVSTVEAMRGIELLGTIGTVERACPGYSPNPATIVPHQRRSGGPPLVVVQPA